VTAADWAQVVGAAGTMITAIVAVIAARQAFSSAKENRETNEQMTRPQVVVYVQSEAGPKFRPLLGHSLLPEYSFLFSQL
jgi:hypothetical protein